MLFSKKGLLKENWTKLSIPMLNSNGRKKSMMKFKNQITGGKTIKVKVRGAIDIGLKKCKKSAPSTDANTIPVRMKYFIFRLGFGSFDSGGRFFLKKR